MPVSATNRMVQAQRPTQRTQKSQRDSFRDNPHTGVQWGETGWPDDTSVTLDLTTEVFGTYPAPFANLAALAGDGTYGDGELAYGSGADFTEGQYVRLDDNSLAHYNTDEWAEGAAPAE